MPAPSEGLLVTNLLIVRDVERSRDFYENVIGGTVVMTGAPSIIKLSNSWIILNTGGGPTDDKPEVVAAPPNNSKVLTSALNFRVADIYAVYELWKSRGATFLTPPIDREREIRCYLTDPDGHLIEVGQTVKS